MISITELNERVREWGLREDVVEKDYVIGWLLWGIRLKPIPLNILGVQRWHMPEEVLSGNLSFL